MTEGAFNTGLQELLELMIESAETENDSTMEECFGTTIEKVRTFEEAEVLSNVPGLVVTLADGKEFQVAVVRSC